MTTTTFGIAFRAEEGTIPAECGIYIKSYSESETRFDKRSLKMLTSECCTSSEVEEEVNRLIRELEELKRQARPLFERSRKAWLKESQPD